MKNYQDESREIFSRARRRSPLEVYNSLKNEVTTFADAVTAPYRVQIREALAPVGKYVTDHFLTEKVREAVGRNPVGKYLVKVSTGIMFYTPLLIGTEFLAGMEPDEVFSSRYNSARAHFIVTPVYIKYREFIARLWKSDTESPKWRKRATEFTALGTFQPPIYYFILSYAGAESRERRLAIVFGLAAGILTSELYGKFVDKYQRFWKVRKPVLHK